MEGVLRYFMFGLVLWALAMSGCERNSTFSDSVTFQSHVYFGHMDQTKNVLVPDGPAAGAVVTCENYSDSAKAASDGSYSLTVKGVRGYKGIDTETYSLKASFYGGDEKVTAYAKPGDTIKVRDFIIYQHTSETAPRRICD